MKALRIVGLILLAALPAGAQTQQVFCQPNAGQLVCQQQPFTTDKRVAIVAGVVIAGAVVALLVHRHKHHTVPAPRGFPQPQPGATQKGLLKEGGAK
jgi:hypothetical protein